MYFGCTWLLAEEERNIRNNNKQSLEALFDVSFQREALFYFKVICSNFSVG